MANVEEGLRDTLPSRRIVAVAIHHALEIALLEAQLASDGRADDRPKLLRVARENDIRIVVAHRFDPDHHLWLCGLPGFVDEDMREMTLRHPDAVSERR